MMIVIIPLLLSSCDTYTGQGAYAGASFGSIIGSAIGGLNDGPRGSDLGTLIGMAGGAAVGAVVGAAADQRTQQARNEDYNERRSSSDVRGSGVSSGSYSRSDNDTSDDSNYTPGDDRINMYNGDDYTGDYSAATSRNYTPSTPTMASKGYSFSLKTDSNLVLDVVNARFVDENRDKVINPGEECKIIFEVFNHNNTVVYDIYPNVCETGGVKNLFISPGLRVESILPGKGIRYTAMVKATKRLKRGMAIFQISVVQGKDKVISKVYELSVPTVVKND